MTQKQLPTDALSRIEANLARYRQEIEDAARRSGREAKSVSLIAVTKYVEPSLIELLYQAGVRDFGESTVQQGDGRRKGLSRLDGARWHLIGHLQRNKVPRALEAFQSIHSVDSLRLLRELRAQARKRSLRLPDLYVEVNLSRQAQRTGLPEEELPGLLSALREEDRLEELPVASRVAGLMGMAPHDDRVEASRPYFRRLRELRDSLAGQGLLPRDAGLSMGMSADFPVAVEEGATLVRVGSFLFEGLVPFH